MRTPTLGYLLWPQWLGTFWRDGAVFAWKSLVPPRGPEPRVIVALYGNLQNPCFEIGIAPHFFKNWKHVLCLQMPPWVAHNRQSLL